MKILLIEDQDILRQAIGMSIKQLFGQGHLTAIASYTAFAQSDINPLAYDVALLDPGAPPVKNGDQTARLAAIAEVQAKLRHDCRIAVITGDYNSTEADSMLKLGVGKYISKIGLGIFELRSALNNANVSKVEPCISEIHHEHFDSLLSHSEMIGHAVDQGIYGIDEISDAMDLDHDTVRKYISRSRKRLRPNNIHTRTL